MRFFISQRQINGNYHFISSNSFYNIKKISIRIFVSFSRIFHKTDTYVGYYVGFIENLVVATLYNLYFFLFVLFFVALCVYVNGFSNDLKSIANHEMNTLGRLEKRTSDPKELRQNNLKFYANLKDFVMLHNDLCE